MHKAKPIIGIRAPGIDKIAKTSGNVAFFVSGSVGCGTAYAGSAGVSEAAAGLSGTDDAVVTGAGSVDGAGTDDAGVTDGAGVACR